MFVIIVAIGVAYIIVMVLLSKAHSRSMAKQYDAMEKARKVHNETMEAWLRSLDG